MKAHRNQVLLWAEQGVIAAERVEEALRLVGVLPDQDAWRRFLDRLLLWSGAVLVSTGIIFFFAYNWDALGNFARFALMELLLAGAVAAILWFDIDTVAGKGSLFAAALLTGGLLALFGQTYQTGADTFELFITWAVAITPWVMVARLPVLWILLVAIINLAFAFYFSVFPGALGWMYSQSSWWILFALNTAALALWEGFALRLTWLHERWAPRLLGFAGGALICFLVAKAIFDSDSGAMAYVVYPLWLSALYAYYRRFAPDLFMLSGAVLSVIVVVTSLLAKAAMEVDGEAEAYLFIGLVVIGLSGLGGWWLRGIAREHAE